MTEPMKRDGTSSCSGAAPSVGPKCGSRAPVRRRNRRRRFATPRLGVGHTRWADALGRKPGIQRRQWRCPPRHHRADASGRSARAAFDAGSGVNEAQLSVGDSSGGVFINDGAGWKLAGINYAADGTYSFGTTDAAFAAALFDQGGLYAVSETNRVSILDLPKPQPGAFYATRVSAHLTWIESVISAPMFQGTSFCSPQLLSLARSVMNQRPFWILVAGTFSLPVPSSARFYRVSATVPTRLTGMAWGGTSLVLSFTGTP